MVRTSVRTALCTSTERAVVCNSRDVADYFGKKHMHVVRDIDALLSKIGSQALFSEIQLEGRTGFGIPLPRLRHDP